MPKPKKCIFLPTQELVEQIIKAMITFNEDEPQEFLKRYGFESCDLHPDKIAENFQKTISS
jgi:hypothetical protein